MFNRERLVRTMLDALVFLYIPALRPIVFHARWFPQFRRFPVKPEMVSMNALSLGNVLGVSGGFPTRSAVTVQADRIKVLRRIFSAFSMAANVVCSPSL